jgi:large repetitive protein
VLTDALGAFLFPNLAAGTYSVLFDRLTTAGGDSDANPTTGATASFTLGASQALTGIDAGLVNNAAPVATEDWYAVARNGTLNVSASAGVLVNDTDTENNPRTAALATGATYGTLTLNADGSFGYTPNTGFRGTDSFTYRPADLYGPGAEVLVTILVGYTPPVASNNTATVNEDGSAAISVLANDTDADGDTLATIGATHGTNGTTTVNANGTIAYTPNANWNGTDTFTYWIHDGFGGLSSATVTVTVDPVNDAPVASNATVLTQRDEAVEIDLRGFVTDIETPAENLTFAVSNAVNGTVQLLADGHTARFTPATGYNGAASFSFTVTDTGDGSSAALSASGTIAVTVNAPPTAGDLSASAHAGGTVTFYPAWIDPDGDMVTLTGFTQGAHGTVTLGPGGFGLVYTAATQTYTGTDTFTYTISDGKGGISTGTVTVTLTNTPPTAPNFTVSIHAGSSTTAYPVYFDIDGDQVTLVGYTQGQHGTVGTGMMGGLTYTATDPTYVGADSFTYTVDDGHGAQATGTITVNLTNQPPTGSDISQSTSVNTPVTVMPSYYDPDGDTLTITSFTQPASGTGSVALNQYGMLVYTPPNGFTGVATFSFVVDDGHGGTLTIHVTITVTA